MITKLKLIICVYIIYYIMYFENFLFEKTKLIIYIYICILYFENLLFVKKNFIICIYIVFWTDLKGITTYAQQLPYNYIFSIYYFSYLKKQTFLFYLYLSFELYLRLNFILIFHFIELLLLYKPAKLSNLYLTSCRLLFLSYLSIYYSTIT